MSEIRIKSQGAIKLFESDNTSHVTIASPASLSANRTITIPDADVTLGAGTTINNNADNRVITGSGTANTLEGEANFTFDGTSIYSQANLKLEHTGDAQRIIRLDADRGAGGNSLGDIEFQWNGNVNAKISGIAGNDTTNKDDANLDFYVRESGSSIARAMTINKDGVVGIGAANVGDLGVGLHIRTADSGGTVDGSADELVLENGSDTGMTILSGTSGTGSVRFGDSGTNDIGRINYDHSANNMQFNTNGSERMRILSDGTVNISTTGSIGSNQGGIHVSRGNGQNGTIAYLDSASTSYDANIINEYCAATSTNSTFNFIRSQSGNGVVFVVRDSGNVQNTNNSYGAYSDERIKQNITDANSQWDDIKALKIRNFKLKSDPTKTQLGVVAQELETANMNGLVEEAKPEKEHVAYHSDFGTIEDGTADNGATPIKDEDDNITGYEDVFTKGQKVKSVKYSVLYMKAIKALQESMERIEQLEAKVTALENA
jgi:hypothetical protein